MDEQDFLAKYDFNNFQVVDVKNPTEEDYKLVITMEVGFDHAAKKMRTEKRTYVIPAGGHERLPGVVARKYLDEMAKYLSQKEDKFKLYVDYNMRAEYFDRLIVPEGIEDRINDYTPIPNTDAGADRVTEAEVQPFAGVAQPGEPARVGRPRKN